MRSRSHDPIFHHHEPISSQNNIPDPFQSRKIVTSALAPSGKPRAARRCIHLGIPIFFPSTLGSTIFLLCESPSVLHSDSIPHQNNSEHNHVDQSFPHPIYSMEFQIITKDIPTFNPKAHVQCSIKLQRPLLYNSKMINTLSSPKTQPLLSLQTKSC